MLEAMLGIFVAVVWAGGCAAGYQYGRDENSTLFGAVIIGLIWPLSLGAALAEWSIERIEEDDE